MVRFRYILVLGPLAFSRVPESCRQPLNRQSRASDEAQSFTFFLVKGENKFLLMRSQEQQEGERRRREWEGGVEGTNPSHDE